METALNVNDNIDKILLPIESIESLLSKGFDDKMAVGYKEMAEINLQLSEICFAAESEVERIFKQDSGE